jgi:hypothetical protein
MKKERIVSNKCEYCDTNTSDSIIEYDNTWINLCWKCIYQFTLKRVKHILKGSRFVVSDRIKYLMKSVKERGCIVMPIDYSTVTECECCRKKDVNTCTITSDGMVRKVCISCKDIVLGDK